MNWPTDPEKWRSKGLNESLPPLIGSGISQSEAARRLRCSPAAVSKALKRLGLEMNEPLEPALERMAGILRANGYHVERNTGTGSQVRASAGHPRECRAGPSPHQLATGR